MLEDLQRGEPPAWLLDASAPLGDLPIRDVLEGSVYYPACGVDGDPIKYLGGNFYSFVYVDYGVGRRALRDELETFRGYRVFASRPVLGQELVPQGWVPRFPAGYLSQRSPPANWIKQPFAEWIVYERLGSYTETHGPKRFSLLYIGGDGAASYQALYHGNKATPAVVAVIRPGTGFGGNWSNFRNRDDILAWSVLDAVPKQRPRWLLEDGDVAPCWPEFATRARILKPGLHLWERLDHEEQERLSIIRARRHERLHELVFKNFCDAMNRDLKHRFWTAFSTQLAHGSIEPYANDAKHFFAEVRFTVRLNRECRTPETEGLLERLVDTIIDDMKNLFQAAADPVMRIRIKDVRTISHARSADATVIVHCTDL